MEHISYPIAHQWEDRKDWFESFIYRYEEAGSYVVGEHASALIADVQCCFCAGAWVAVIVLVQAVMESGLKEISGNSVKTTAFQLFRDHGFATQDFEWLRRRRNALVHGSNGAFALTVDKQWDERDALETEARQAVAMMFQVFYSHPGT